MTTDEEALAENPPVKQPGMRQSVLDFIERLHDQDLTVAQICQALNLTKGQVQAALWGLRSTGGSVAAHIELGGNDRPGHVRYYKDLADRPLKSRSRNSTVGKRKPVRKPRKLSELARTSAPPPTKTEQTELSPWGTATITVASNGGEPRVVFNGANGAAETANPTAYLPVGGLQDGRLVLASVSNPGVLLVAEPYGSLLDGPIQ